MSSVQKRKRKAFYRRCAAGEKRAKERRMAGTDGALAATHPIRHLEPGMTGFLLTVNNKEERSALMEAYRLLNEAHERLNGDKVKSDERSKTPESDDDADLDVASALRRELEDEARTADRYVFHGVKTGVSNVAFVLNQSSRASSADLAHEVFRQVLETGEASSRHLLRFQPVIATCKPNKEDLRALVRRAWKVYWEGDDGVVDGLPLCLLATKVPLQRTRFLEKGEDKKHSYTVNFRVRNYDKLGKQEAVMAVLVAMQEVAPSWNPTTAGADLIISVDVLCNVLCLSFLEKFKDYAKYNIHEAAHSMSSLHCTSMHTTV